MNKLALAIGAISLLSIPSTQADIVHLDDVIVTGSECVGFDCVNGESFGFDTIRMKENNVRLHFDDTSTSASFPRNDWRIIINDSSNGGGEYFAIEDSTAGRQVFRVDAGAPANSLHVNSSGNVGIGASTPIVELHVKDGDSPTLRLEQDGSAGFTPQTWDMAGNEANFFIRDVTNGSQLPFKILPGADSDSLVITADGDIGIGTKTPTGHLEVKDTNAAFITINSGTTSGSYGEILFQGAGTNFWSFGSTTQNKRFYFYNYNRSEYELTINDVTGYIGLGGILDASNPIEHSNGALLTAAGTWQNASSRELKDNIKDLTVADAVEALDNLKPVTYHYKAEPSDNTVGFIAEDVPDLVATKSRKTLSAMDIVGVLTKVVQDQQSTIAELNTRLNKLEAGKDDI